MNSEVFERSYVNEKKEQVPPSNPNPFNLICVVPEKYVPIPGSERFYIGCLRRMNQLAMKNFGKIRAVFSCELHTAEIRVELPSIPFEDAEDMEALAYIANHAKRVTLTEEDDHVVFIVSVHCFVPACSDDEENAHCVWIRR